MKKGPSAFIERIYEKEVESPPRAWIELDSSAVLQNYQAILNWVHGQSILPLLQGNAFGHGAGWAGRLLARMPGLYGLGVSTLTEGVELRLALGARESKTPILVFSDSSPWSVDKGQICEKHGLRIALSSPADWSLFLSQGWTKRISYELELNIGMNHNGISIHHLNSLIQSLRKIPAEYRPTGIFSSLWSQKQLSLWDEIRKKLSSLLPGTQFHFASDSEIWNQKEFGLHERGDAIRPGLTLFGIPPWKSAPLRGILPALTLKSQIVAVHRLRPGEWVGAGGRFRVTGSDPINAAVLAIGFGDGLMRRLENRGYGWLNGKETRFLGPIGIDYCSVRGGASTRVGEEVELFGSKVDPWAQAEAAETIPEEILTSLASRVKRKYDTSFSSKSTS